jgi:hypothetical protein
MILIFHPLFFIEYINILKSEKNHICAIINYILGERMNWGKNNLIHFQIPFEALECYKVGTMPPPVRGRFLWQMNKLMNTTNPLLGFGIPTNEPTEQCAPEQTHCAAFWCDKISKLKNPKFAFGT